MYLLYLLILSISTQHVYTTYICFLNSNCLFDSSNRIISEPNCCSVGGISYSTITEDIISEDCIQCDFILNLTIQPSEQYYTAEILYTPYGGQLILTFPVEIHSYFTPVASNVTLPTSLPFPLESRLEIVYTEGNGEAAEYSRISETAGSLYGGVIDSSTYEGSGIPDGKFIPIARKASYEGTVFIQAEYLLAAMRIEVGYSFVILECLECENGGYPNAACTQCECPLDYVGKLCQSIITNTTNCTCQNNGTCQVLSDLSTQCHCTAGFKGDICQFDIDECSTGTHNCPVSSQCKNIYGNYSCFCNQGYTGANCDVDIDECQVVFCAFHSTCHNYAGGFDCVCNIGYTGFNCDTRISSCLHGNCSVNTSICIDSLYGNINYTCICSEGFEGQFCTVDVDECKNENKPCLAWETCVNTFGGYLCNCEIDKCGVTIDNSGLNVIIGLGIAFIFIIVLIGVGIITSWVMFLLSRYLKAVRVNAKYVMVRKLEKERLHDSIGKRIPRNLKANPKKKNKLNNDIEMEPVMAINYNAVTNDLTRESSF